MIEEADKASIKKPTMYPPVGPVSLPMPPSKPENTGIPSEPRKIYRKSAPEAIGGGDTAGALETLARRLKRQKEFQLEGEEYKRPKGDPGPLLFPWYNRRQIVLSSDHNCEGLLFTPELADQVLAGFRFLVPYYRWMDTLAGDPPPEQMK